MTWRRCSSVTRCSRHSWSSVCSRTDLLDLAHDLGAELARPWPAMASSAASMMRSRISSSAMPSSSAQSSTGRSRPSRSATSLLAGRRRPTARHRRSRGCAWRRGRRSTSWRMSATVSATSSSPISSMRCSKIDLALVVHHVVEFEQVLADVEVARLDLLLRLLQRLVDPGMDDRLALLEAELAAACRPCARSRRCASGRLRSDRKNFERPGSPWRPERPRSWLSMRRLSWRSVPST